MERQPGERETANGETAMVVSHHQERAALISSADTIYQALYDSEYPRERETGERASGERAMVASPSISAIFRPSRSGPLQPTHSTHTIYIYRERERERHKTPYTKASYIYACMYIGLPRKS
jgi:hypothetical protein